MALIALVALGIVLLSLEESVATAGALVRVAFLLAIAYFLFLVWRERRGDIEAVLDIAALTGLGPNGPESVVFVLVLVACVYAVVRVWRREHTYA
jgi:hypothetical protein